MLCYKKLTVLPIIVGALGTIPKMQVKETRQTGNQWNKGKHVNITQLKLPSLLRRVIEKFGDLLPLELQ